MVFLAFIGGIVGAIAAVMVQYGFQVFIENNGIGRNSFGVTTAFAAMEEFFKFAAVFIAVSRSKYFDEPIDAMIYMIAAAAGMAAVENVSIMVGSEFLGEKIGILIFRFLGATLLHVLSSALLGYYWAKGIIKNKVWTWVGLGIVLASLLHALFNYFIIIFNGGLIYSILFLIIAAFFIFYDFEKLKKTT